LARRSLPSAKTHPCPLTLTYSPCSALIIKGVAGPGV
jgi:hypothetical protein